MNFISWAFVLLLIPVLVARWTIGRDRTERSFLYFVTAASTVFVCWYVPAYIGVMLVSIGVDYVAAIYIDRAPPGSPTRRVWLAASMTVNLLLLGFFKYADFFLEQTHAAWGLVHTWHHPPTRLNILLPIGISFYTFGSMSYTIDVYRGRLKPVRDFRDFYFFLTFFPHMVAGPIIRAEQFFYQMGRRRRVSVRVLNEGGYQIIRGLFLKMVCADNLAAAVNDGWNDGYKPGTPSARSLSLAVLFAAQIFCDFEGYTGIARGLAYWLGYRFPVNFNNPYLAGSFSDFWARWHITLSSWLRDYLYIPLGGNRVSPRRTYVNLMTVMALGGLWHGPAMTFVAWGVLHGSALCAERFFKIDRTDRGWRTVPRRFGWYLVVQATVLVTWILFRSDTLRHAIAFVGNIVRFQRGQLDRSVRFACLFAIPVVVMHAHGRLVECGYVRPLGRLSQAALAGVMLLAVLTCYGTSNEFIYFQF